MNFLSRLGHYKIIGERIIWFLAVGLVISGCYSFSGGSVPPHLKTLRIPPVDDNSGFGRPEYRESFTEIILDKFRNDNALELVNDRPDAQLKLAITSITDVTTSVSVSELEDERNVTVRVRARYEDLVNEKELWENQFSKSETYAIDEGQEGLDRTVQILLDLLADDILEKVVSDW